MKRKIQNFLLRRMSRKSVMVELDRHEAVGLDYALTFNFLAAAIGPQLTDERFVGDHTSDDPRLWAAVRDAIHAFADTPVSYFEFGVYKGCSLAWWAGQNHHLDSRFLGFDSFEGLPEAWPMAGTEAGHFSLGGEAPVFDDQRIQCVKGPFSETVAPFMSAWTEGNDHVICHFDADLFSSTACALSAVLQAFHDRPMIWIFDEFVSEECKAFEVFCRGFGFAFDVIAFSGQHRRYPWRIAFRVTPATARGHRSPNLCRH